MSPSDTAGMFKTRMNELCKLITGTDSPARLAAELRLPERNIARYCAGESQPRLPEAVLLAQKAGVSLDWLTGLTDELDRRHVKINPTEEP